MNGFNKSLGFLTKEKRGGLMYSAMIIAFILLSFIVQIALRGLKENNLVAYTAVFTGVTALVLISVSVLFNDGKYFSFVRVKKFSPYYLLAAALLFVGMFMGLGFINILVKDSLASIGITVTTTDITVDTLTEYIVYTVFIAILPAVTEEIFFRGALVSCSDGIGIIKKSLFIALLFALYHGSVAQLFYQFLFGIGLTVLSVKAGSVIPSIVGHFLNNFAIITFFYFKVTIDFFNGWYILIGVFALCVFAFLIAFKKSEKPKEKGKLFDFFLFSSAGIAVTLILIIGGMFL